MANHNTYEEYVNEILQEAPQGVAKNLKAAQDALVKMGGKEGEELFKGPGLISNKYGADKRYYPNIRASFMGWRNISLDKASTTLIQRLNELGKIDTWNPEWNPEGSPIQGMVSAQYSSNFVPNSEAEMQSALENLRKSYERMPLNTDMQNELDALINELSEMDKSSDPNAYKALEKKKNDLMAKLVARMESGVGQGAKRKYEDALKRFGPDDPRTQQLYKAFREEEIALNKNVSSSFDDQYGVPSVQAPAAQNTTGAEVQQSVADTGAAVQTMGMKAAALAQQATQGAMDREKYTYEIGSLQQQHVNMIRQEFEKAFQKFETIMSARGALSDKEGSSNSQIDSPDEAIPGTVLRSDGTVYRDQWGSFVNNIQNAIIGTAQRGYTAGGDLLSILRGKAGATYKKRGEQELGGEKGIQSLDPAILKQVHDKIMVPLFLSKQATMLYATSEQWDSVSEGGRLYKGATGFGAQGYSAGSNRPKVSL